MLHAQGLSKKTRKKEFKIKKALASFKVGLVYLFVSLFVLFCYLRQLFHCILFQKFYLSCLYVYLQKRKKRRNMDTTAVNFSALHLVNDPQGRFFCFVSFCGLLIYDSAKVLLNVQSHESVVG